MTLLTLSHLAPRPHADVKIFLKVDITKFSCYQLRVIAKVKHYLLQQDLPGPSCLDSCNSYFGKEQSSVRRLQSVQNAAARLLTAIKQHES